MQWANASIGVSGGIVGVVALAAGPYVWFRPNRIVEGEAATALSTLGGTAWVAMGLWLLAAFAALWADRLPIFAKHRIARPVRRPLLHSLPGITRGLLGSTAFLLLLGQTGSTAANFASVQGTAARTSFGWGFYLFAFALYLVLFSAAADTPNRLAKWTLLLVPFVGIAALATCGTLQELGIVREWTMARSIFARELSQHLFYALGATGGAIVLGVPLGALSARRPRVRAVVMTLLNLGQVLPVLAFVGIMMPILGALGDHLPGLKTLGVSGIGWAPVMAVLLVYALFPVTRNTLVAIQQLDPAVLDTARGMGMSPRRIFWEVELPLAFPVVLAGVRVALVQSTAGAIIAAFVGGGGLGTIMFMGLEQTSMDLVLVGVIPIAALALCFDALLRGVEYLTGRRQRTVSAVVAP
jgi:osmoprotectant transport system permease protein